MKLDCAYCHTAAKTGERAGFPLATTCMVCHPGKFAALPPGTNITPARSVYMLADFVFFSHAKHHAANITCRKCHGDIWTEETVSQVLPMTMKACITCHKTTHAKVGCTTCHELNQ